MRPDIFSWGLRIGSLYRIAIRLHWVLLLFWAMELRDLLKIYDPLFGRQQSLLAWLLMVGLSLLVILIHEFGHCFAARAVDGDADEVLLWPLGGLAFVSYPRNPRNQLIVSGGGPGVQAVLLLLAWGTFTLCEYFWNPQGIFYAIARGTLVDFNFFILCFNLIPLYPLDGGSMFQALAWGYQERQGGSGMGPYYRASTLTIKVSIATLVLTLLFDFLHLNSGYGLLLAIFIGSGIYRLHLELKSGAGPHTTFGHDFSRGYSSLEGQQQRRREKAPREPGPIARFRKRLEERREARYRVTPEEERRLDGLLDKISSEGMGALDEEERDFLERVSRKKKKQG